MCVWLQQICLSLLRPYWEELLRQAVSQVVVHVARGKMQGKLSTSRVYQAPVTNTSASQCPAFSQLAHDFCSISLNARLLEHCLRA